MSSRSKAKSEFTSLKKTHFPKFKRGDILFVNNHSSLFSLLISIKAKKDSGECNATHVERYLGNGIAITSDLRIKCHSIQDYFNGNYDIFLFSNVKYSQMTRNALSAESIIYHGSIYDSLGIIGQATSFFTGIDAFKYLINSPNLFYCSEFIYTVENFVMRQSTFPYNYMELSLPATPDDLFDYLFNSQEKGWNLTYRFCP